MRVTFILPGISTCPMGGFKIVFEYANRLTALGHRVTLCFHYDARMGRMGPMPIPDSLKRAMGEARNAWFPRWFKLDRRVKKMCVLSIDGSSTPDADWVFATAMGTAQPVASLPASKGRKAYLIQDYENWGVSEDEVHETYRLGMKSIVVSRWLKQIVDEHAIEPCVCIPNPIDVGAFRPDEKALREPHAVSLLYHTGERKGWAYAWEAIQAIHDEMGDLTVRMFGTHRKPSSMPPWVHYTRNASEAQLRHIYSATSAYVCASINEGFGLTCVEAMACGCALVATDFEGSREYAVPHVDSLVSPVADTMAMAGNTVRVLTGTGLRDRLASAGMVAARTRGWDEAVAMMERALEQ